MTFSPFIEFRNPFEESKCGDAFSKVCKDSKYRTYDGSCNNKYYPTWGMTFTRYARLIPANYADGKEKNIFK